MSQHVLFLCLGLGLGSVYAMFGAGLVLTYEGTGVVNFAIAAVATIPVYVYSGLKTNGVLALPVPWVPDWHVGQPSMLVALIISMVVATVLGILTYLLVAYPLRKAPVLARVVASIGVLVTVQAAIGLRYGTTARQLRDVLPTGTWHLAGAQVPRSRLYLTLVVIALVLGMTLWLRRSRTGLAIRAAAENEQTASLARLSPQRLGLVTSTVATVSTSLVFCLAGTVITPLTPSNTALLVVPGLAAAILGRLRSLPIALMSGLVLGVISSEVSYLSGTQSWWPAWGHQGIRAALPFLFIVVALFAVGRSIPSRGEDASDRLPPVFLPRNRPTVVAGATLLGVVSLLATSGTVRFSIIITLATALITLSLVVLTGMVGQISIAQAALAGMTGFTLVKIGTGVPFPLSLLLAAGVATAVGVLVGLPALRIRGAQLAVVTLAAALALDEFVLSNPNLTQGSLAIPEPKVAGYALGIQSGHDIARIQFGLLVLALVVVAFVIVGNLMRGGSGRTWLAVRSNERAAASIGIDVARVKLSAFALASMLAGIGGGLSAYCYGSFSAESFNTFAGLSFLAIAYMGGVSSAGGAIAGAALVPLGVNYLVIDRYLHLGIYYELISGIGLIITVIFNPIGIAGAIRDSLAPVVIRLRRYATGIPTAVPRASAEGRTAQRVAPTPSSPDDDSPALRPRHLGEVVFSATDVVVQFGGLVAVNGVNIEVREGEVIGLVGPNGSGKTTFIDAVTGFVPATGEVHVGAVALHREPPHRRARLGLVRTWQSLELFGDLSGRDNVRVPTDATHRRFSMLREATRPNRGETVRVDAAMDMLGLDREHDRWPADMSLGEQKLLGVARSLATGPKVLLLDEPAAGLDSAESLEFGRHLRTVASTGVACLLVDHDMQLVMGICDRIYVLSFGQVIATGTPHEVSNNPAVIAAYLGSAPLAEAPA